MFPYPRHTVAEVSTNLSTPSFVFDFLEEAVKCADESILIRKFYEGDLIQSGEKVVQLEGNGRAILTAWQVAAPLMDLAVAVMAKVGDAQEQLQSARIDVTHRLDLDNSTDKIIKYVLEQSGATLFGSRLDEIIHITLEHGRWVGSAKEAAEKAIEEAGDIRKLIKIIVDMDSIEEAASLLDMQIDYVRCRGFSAENIRSMGETTKGWLHMIIDESIPLNEAKTLRDAGVRLYALDFSLTKINESTFNINFTK
ncbi:MAG: hypothetical protein CMG27_01075 [Candidatus Marinimicrobia bacterium]|nr:hypothetical protein [Candidatus Neomarinimicrobiota bacterium]